MDWIWLHPLYGSTHRKKIIKSAGCLFFFLVNLSDTYILTAFLNVSLNHYHDRGRIKYVSALCKTSKVKRANRNMWAVENNTYRLFSGQTEVVLIRCWTFYFSNSQIVIFVKFQSQKILLEILGFWINCILEWNGVVLFQLRGFFFSLSLSPLLVKAICATVRRFMAIHFLVIGLRSLQLPCV